MKVSIVAIGDELLLGSVIDTNTSFLASLIDAAGWTLVQSCQVHDDPCDILFAIKEALRRGDIVLTTGGLGPTKDDITKQVLCDYFGGKLVYDPEVAANVERIFAERGLPMNKLTASQAMVPDCCTVIPNITGTAPVMLFERDGKALVSMPGVPREMRYVFTSEVLPRLRQRAGQDSNIIKHRIFQLEGISESALNTSIETLDKSAPLSLVHIAYLPKPGYLTVRLDHDDETVVDSAALQFAGRYKEYIFATEDVPPAETLIDLLAAHHLSVSTAESCTGGNIAHLITSIPGSSSVFNGSVVSYSNEVKINLLGVSPATIESVGAVSTEVAAQMSAGVIKAIGTECAMATSGIAGPAGAVPGKPVGTVCIAVATAAGVHSDSYHFTGGRADVIAKASVKAIILLIRKLTSEL